MVRAEGPSLTALSAARHRGEHQVLERGVLFTDPLALPLLGVTPEKVAVQARRDEPSRRMRLFVAGRSRFAEERALAAIGGGVAQIVVLGAGLDTFAYRLQEAGLPVTAFEVDHPATQRWKQDQLAAAGVHASERVVHVPVDFETGDVLAELSAHGFDPGRPAVFLWLGVLPYLTLPAVEATLRTIASVRGAELVFDYGEPVGSMSGPAAVLHRERAERVASLGEPWLTFLTPEELLDLLRRNGFRLVEDADAVGYVRRALGVPGQQQERRSPAHYVHAVSDPRVLSDRD